MAIFAEVTENERIIDRHLRGIHPFLDYDSSESQSMISIWLKLAYQHYMALVWDPDFNIMQQSHGLICDSFLFSIALTARKRFLLEFVIIISGESINFEAPERLKCIGLGALP